MLLSVYILYKNMLDNKSKIDVHLFKIEKNWNQWILIDQICFVRAIKII